MTKTLHEAFALRAPGQLLVCEKSAAFAPVSVMPEIVTAALSSSGWLPIGRGGRAHRPGWKRQH